MKLPQLTLRDLFWLVLVCAILCGWWLSRSQLLAEIERLRFQTEVYRSQLEVVARFDKLIREQEELTAPEPQRSPLPKYFPVLESAQHEAMIAAMANEREQILAPRGGGISQRTVMRDDTRP